MCCLRSYVSRMLLLSAAAATTTARQCTAWIITVMPSSTTRRTATASIRAANCGSGGNTSLLRLLRASTSSSSTDITDTSSSDSSSSSSSSSTTEEEQVSITKNTSRLSHGENNYLSLDVKTISNHLDVVLSHLSSRRAGADTMAAATTIANLAQQRVQLIQKRDDYLNQRKEWSAVVGKLMRDSNNNEQTTTEKEQLAQAKEASTEAAENAAVVETELDAIQTQMDDLLAGIPNLLDDRVPDGTDENDNEVIATWGDITALPQELGWYDDDEANNNFEPAWHDDIASKLGGYMSNEAVKMSGARFVALSGVVAQLERAIAMFFVDLHVTQHGYTEVSVPLVVSRTTLEGTSQLPKFADDLFAIDPQSHTCNGQDAFLIPTAEVPVTNLHRDQVLERGDLPLRYVAWTPCFRAEAGSYGRDTRGLIRTHQFYKVELVQITAAGTSDAHHEELTAHAEACLRALQLPYRKVRLCSGDIGFAARHCYDLEVWLPGAREYREISSCSNTGDFQARRMALRYRPNPSNGDDNGGGGKKKNKKKPKPQLCHTINGSGLAVGRTLVAVLENYQKPDGSVVVPKVLRPYMGGKEILEPTTLPAAST